jgi:DNA-binding transcriptional ArsR family regulator
MPCARKTLFDQGSPMEHRPRVLVLDGLSDAADRVHVQCSPVVECCLALWVARAPEREPLALKARQLEERLPGSVASDAAKLDRLRPNWPLELLAAFYRADVKEVEQAVDFVHDGQLDTVPSDRRGMMLRVITHIWRAAFATVWKREREVLAVRCVGLTSRLQERPGPTLTGLSPRAVSGGSGDRLKIHHDGEPIGTVLCSQLEALEVMLSLWLRRRIVVGRAQRRIGLCVPCTQGDLVAVSPDRVAGLLSVLGDSRRLHILLLCMSQPRTTQELAKLVELSEPPTSRHLQELKRHGLVVARRDGRYVLYRGVPEELARVSSELRGLLSESLTSTALQDPSISVSRN